jgi:hypothetical protein
MEKGQCELSSLVERTREVRALWRASVWALAEGAWVWERALEVALGKKRSRSKEKHSWRTLAVALLTASCGSGET